jgi:hypothetical protein
MKAPYVDRRSDLVNGVEVRCVRGPCMFSPCFSCQLTVKKIPCYLTLGWGFKPKDKKP